ncbi:MAG: hypothetical protein WCY09_01835 [Candidatus Omnitrophota bacterium]
MSIIISVAIPEGIVLAADSRQTNINPKQQARVGSDFASKVFQLSPRIAVATFGWGFLKPETANSLISIGALVEDFRSTLDPEINVAEAATRLSEYFQQIYNYNITSLKWNPAPQGGIAVGFQVVGYNQNSTVGEVHLCQIPPGAPSLLRNTNNAGCNWNGQVDVVMRLVLGFDPRIEQLPVVQHILANPPLNQLPIATQVAGLQYVINWSTMALQDAVDFALLMVNSTIKMQRFSDGINMSPGDVPGCGGDVDIAVITHRDGFKWIQKKELQIKS